MKTMMTLIAAIALASPAFASKARMAALGNAQHLKDVQSIFTNISDIWMIGDFATFEFGATSTSKMGVNAVENDTAYWGSTYATALGTYSPNAEGGFVRSYGDYKYGFYVGRKSQFTATMRNAAGFLGQDNTLEYIYGGKSGDLKWAASLNYSSADKKQAYDANNNADTTDVGDSSVARKQSTMGARVGVNATNWDAYLIFGLGSTAKGAGSITGLTASDADADFKGTTGFKLGGGYWMGQLYLFGNMYQDGAKINRNSNTVNYDLVQSQTEIGAIDYLKFDGGQFFYGATYAMFSSDDKNKADASDSNKVTSTRLPFIIGIEAAANSWLTLRGSVRQNVLTGSSKAMDAESNSIANNTRVNAGVGIAFNKFTMDASLEGVMNTSGAAATGDINTTDLLANTSLTYMF